MADGQTVSSAPANVVVVATDGERLGQYEAALRKAQISTKATLDADEAEALVASLSPDVLVLDRGLPRLVLFRLYGLVREDASETPVQIVFVGQEGETGPGDHYLPGEPSPSIVAERVAQLLPSAGPASTTDQGDNADVARGSAAPAPGIAPTDDTAAEGTAEADAPKKSGRRLDVILIRVGLVLLILGALLILIQSDAFPPSLTPPAMAPATPTHRPTASPKPGAFLDDAGARVSGVVGRG
jgi:hypothetical protein